MRNKFTYRAAWKAGYRAAKKKLNESTTNSKFEELKKLVWAIRPTVSAWSKGIAGYAEEMIERLVEYGRYEIFSLDLGSYQGSKKLEGILLGGASDWDQLSWGGSYEMFDQDIAKRLCSPTELKATRGGLRAPNSHEQWKDVQARALFQASVRVKEALMRIS